MPSPHAERLNKALAALPQFQQLPATLRSRVESFALLQDLARGGRLWDSGDPAEHYRLQRSPQPSHGLGGVSPTSAVRKCR